MEILVWPKRLLKLMGILPKQSVKYPLILLTIIKWLWFGLIFYIIIPQVGCNIIYIYSGSYIILNFFINF